MLCQIKIYKSVLLAEGLSPLTVALDLEVAVLHCMMTGMKFLVSSRSLVLLSLK